MADIDAGRVVRQGDHVRLEFVRRYDATALQVWSALTDPDLVTRWFGSWSGDPASGSVELLMTTEPDAAPETVHIEVCDPPARLAVTMDSADGAWPLVVTLREAGSATVLTFEHRLAEPYDVSSIAPGWRYYLDRLGAVVAGKPVPDDWNAYLAADADASG